MQNLFSTLSKSVKLPSNEGPTLHRSQSSIVSSSQAASFIRITGNYTFFLSPEITPKELPLTQSHVLTLNAFTDSTCKYAIAFSCKWFRIINEKSYSLPINSNTFVFSSFDIGVSLKCEVKSEEDDFKGVAILTVGPISIDEMLRSDVENIMGGNHSKYLVRLVNEAKDLVGKEKFVMNLNKDSLKFTGPTSITFLELQYSLSSPDLEVDYNDANRISLRFGPESPDHDKVRSFLAVKDSGDKLRLGVLFENKNLKDVFLLVFRLNNAKKYLFANKLIDDFSSLEKYSNIKSLPGKAIDILLEVENLKRKNQEILKENKEMVTNSSRLSEKSTPKNKENSGLTLTKTTEEKRLLEKRIFELETQLKEMQNPSKMFQEFDMKQSFLSDISVIERFAKEDNVTARDSDYESEITVLKKRVATLQDENKRLALKANEGEMAVELKMMNEMLKMEVNTYKAQREAQVREIAHLKEAVEKVNLMKTAGNREDAAKMKEAYESKIMSLENQLKSLSLPVSAPSNAEISRLLEDNTKLKLEIDRLNKDSIIQRGKLIAERDKLKQEVSQYSKMAISNKSISGADSPNVNFNSEEIVKLKQELEATRRSSIIERGKLIEERNKLKAEIDKLRFNPGLPSKSSENFSLAGAELEGLKAEYMDYKRKSQENSNSLLEENKKLKEENLRLGDEIKRVSEEKQQIAESHSVNASLMADFRRLSSDYSVLTAKLNEKDQRIGGLLIEANENRERIIAVSQDNSGLKSIVTEKEHRLSAIIGENDKLKAELDEIHNKFEVFYLNAQQESRRYIEENSRLNQEKKALEDHLALENRACNEKIANLEREAEKQRESFEKSREEAENLNKNLINSKIGLIEENNRLRNEVEEVKKGLIEENQRTMSEIERISREKAEFYKEIEELRTSRSELLGNLDRSQHELEALSAQFNAKIAKYKKLKSLFKEKQALLQEKESLLSDFHVKLSAKDSEFAQYQETSTRQIRDLQQKCSEKEHQIQQISSQSSEKAIGLLGENEALRVRIEELSKTEESLRNDVKLIFMEKEANLKKSVQFSRELKEKTTECKEKAGEIEVLKTKIWELESRIEEIQVEKIKSQSDLIKKAEEKEEEGRKMQEVVWRLEKELEDRRREWERKEGEWERKEGDWDQLIREKQQECDQLHTHYDRLNEVLSVKVSSFEQSLAQKDQALGDLALELTSQKTAVHELSQRLSLKDREIFELTDEKDQILRDLSHEIDRLRAEKQEFSRILGVKEQEIGKINSDLESLALELNARLDRVCKENQEREERERELRERLGSEAQVNEEMRLRNNELSTQLLEISEKLRSTEDSLQTLESETREREHHLRTETVKKSSIIEQTVREHEKTQASLRQIIEELSYEKNQLLEKNQKNAEKISEILKEKDYLGREIGSLEGRNKELEGRNRGLEVEIKEFEGRVRELEGMVKGLEGMINELEGRKKEFEGKIKELEVSVSELTSRNLALEGKLKEKTEESVKKDEELARKEEDCQQKITELEQKINTKVKTHTEMIKTKKSQIEFLENSLKTLNETLTEKEDIIKKRKAELQEISERLAISEGNLRSEAEKLTKLTEELESMRGDRKKEQDCHAVALEGVKGQLSESEKRVKELNAKLEDFEKARLENSRSLAEKHLELEASERKLLSLTEKFGVLQAELARSHEALEKLKTENLESLEREKSHLDREFKEIMEKLEEKLRSSESSLSARSAELEEAKQKLEKETEKSESKGLTIRNLETTIQKMALELNILTEKSREIEGLTAKLELLKDEHDRNIALLEENEKERSACSAEIGKLNGLLSETRAELAQSRAEKKALEEEIEEKSRSSVLSSSKTQTELQNMINNLTISYERLLKENIRLTDENRENQEKIELLENDLQEVTEEKDGLLVEMSKMLNG